MTNTLECTDSADPYIEETCVHSDSFEVHMIDLRHNLEANREATIQLWRDNC